MGSLWNFERRYKISTYIANYALKNYPEENQILQLVTYKEGTKRNGKKYSVKKQIAKNLKKFRGQKRGSFIGKLQCKFEIIWVKDLKLVQF